VDTVDAHRPPYEWELARGPKPRCASPVQLYANRVVIVARTRWGRIVEHEDFYLDTARTVAFEEKLAALGIAPAARVTVR
jgi:ketosteroid isomerase-like protein